jgi:hypothetical protein
MSQPGLALPMLRRRRRDQKNTLAFFDVTVDGQHIGRIVFELFVDAVPKVITPKDSQHSAFQCKQSVDPLH